jgi:hypothetical protein
MIECRADTRAMGEERGIAVLLRVVHVAIEHDAEVCHAYGPLGETPTRVRPDA